MLLDKILFNKRVNSRTVIGLIGIHHGAGVTYTGLMLTFSLGIGSGMKTAYLECNNHHDLELLQETYEWNREDGHSFTMDCITFYKNVSQNRIADILGEDYECYILDFGTDFKGNREEFLRCGWKLVLSGYAPWCLRKLIRFTRSEKPIRGREAWLHLLPCADKKVVARMAKETGRVIHPVPYEPDPTSPSNETRQFFDRILG